MAKTHFLPISFFYPTRKLRSALFIMLTAILITPDETHATTNKHKDDTHYTEVGFFDIHVCNWPDRPLFFMALFSTTHFDNIKKIEIFDNTNTFLDELDLTKYRMIMLKKPKREKRVFLKQIEIPKTSSNGWYVTKVHMTDGKIVTGKDYVIIHKMHRASGMQPAERSNLNVVPKKLSWNTVPGATHYQVFINDAWEGKSLYSSDLLTKPELELPKNLLKRGGSYCWRIHARDVNENVLLGDFNHGSLTKCFELDIKE